MCAHGDEVMDGYFAAAGTTAEKDLEEINRLSRSRLLGQQEEEIECRITVGRCVTGGASNVSSTSHVWATAI